MTGKIRFLAGAHSLRLGIIKGCRCLPPNGSNCPTCNTQPDADGNREQRRAAERKKRSS